MTQVTAHWRFFSAALLLGLCTSFACNAQAPVAPVAATAAPYRFERVLYGRSDLVSASTGESFLNLVLGASQRQQTPDAGLARPQAIAAHQGRVFVVNALDFAVSVFDLRQRQFYKIGEQGEGALQQPVGLSVGRDGTLLVADAAANAIVVFDAHGGYLRRIGGPQWFSRLSNVTADPDGDRVYAIDNGKDGQWVRVFNAIDGRHLFDFGKEGDGAGEFDQPFDLAVGHGGQLAVVDSGNLRVQIFDHEGKYLRSLGGPGKRAGEFLRPKEIATDAQGNWYVVDASLANVQVFSAQGNFLYALGARDSGDGAAHYLMPSGVAIDSDGRLYVVDSWYGKMEVYARDN